jgi:hypothetical protein
VVGHHTDVWDVLISIGVPDDKEIREAVVDGLECPKCGAGIDLSDDVGVRFDFEIDYDIALEKAQRRLGHKLESFAKHLEAYPMLGAAHPVGKRILNEIAAFPRTRLDKTTWYRARRLEGGTQFGPDDIRLPPSDSVLSPGRFNHLGQAHWYLAESDYTAMSETIEPPDTLAWLQKWTVNPLEPILNLARFGPDDPWPNSSSRVDTVPLLALAMIFGGHLNREVDRERGWKPEYFIPHYVADAAKRAGFQGIRFTSIGFGDVNLVIFARDAPVEAEGNPVIANIMEMQGPLFSPF